MSFFQSFVYLGRQNDGGTNAKACYFGHEFIAHRHWLHDTKLSGYTNKRDGKTAKKYGVIVLGRTN